MTEPFTVGVEEEFLTLDAHTLELRPRAQVILHAARRTMGETVQPELTLAQIEVATPVCTELDDLGRSLRSVRRQLDEAARAQGCTVAATGTHPCGEWTEQAITPTDRFLAIEQDYQQLAREQLICGCHVHVGIDDPDDLVRVMDRVRPFVPVLLALGANSPFWQGVDTGYASYRTQIFDRWPTAGPPPVCGDRAGYRRAVRELVDVGMIPDDSYLYWHLRPSGHYPTLELRVADVGLTADETTMLAGLFRSLVRTTHASLDGPEPTHPSHEVLRASTWRACRYGLDGTLVDPLEAREAPAGEVVVGLLDRLRPDLEDHGEWELVSGTVGAALAGGNGAQRQRAALRTEGTIDGVTRMIVRSTPGARVPAPGETPRVVA